MHRLAASRAEPRKLALIQMRSFLTPPFGYNSGGNYALTIELPEFNVKLHSSLWVKTSNEAKALQTKIMEALKGEYICKKCGLRQEGEKVEADF